MDTFPDDHDSHPFDIEAIEFTESLAHSKAFENYLFDHMAQRHATHTMTDGSQPLTFNSDRIQTILPEELRNIFGDDTSIIDGLSVVQQESHDLSYTFMRFNVNGEKHTFTAQSDEDFSLYTRPNTYGEPSTYKLAHDSLLGFLASLVYVREYSAIQTVLESRMRARMNQSGDQQPETDLFSMEESNIEARRIGNSDAIERLIMTLGHFDGLSEIETSSFLPVDDRLLLISLTQAESPQLGYVSNELNLSILEETPQQVAGTSFNRLGLSQQLGDIKAFRGEDFNDQIGEVTSGEQTTIIRPEKDTKAWSILCGQFARTMKGALEPYAHHDDIL